MVPDVVTRPPETMQKPSEQPEPLLPPLEELDEAGISQELVPFATANAEGANESTAPERQSTSVRRGRGRPRG